MTSVHPSKTDLPERRRARRGACDHAATVRKRGCYAVQGRVADLTADGCRIVGVGPFPADGEVWVRLEGLEGLASRAIWSKPGLTGARFDRPLHPAVVARYLPAASRMTLIAQTGEERGNDPALAHVADDLTALSNRARIMRGVADLDASPLVAVKCPIGGNLAALIQRRAARPTETFRVER